MLRFLDPACLQDIALERVSALLDMIPKGLDIWRWVGNSNANCTRNHGSAGAASTDRGDRLSPSKPATPSAATV